MNKNNFKGNSFELAVTVVIKKYLKLVYRARTSKQIIPNKLESLKKFFFFFLQYLSQFNSLNVVQLCFPLNSYNVT
jgi:hypothetical protein